MSKHNSPVKILLALLLVLFIFISSLGASRTISSQTIQIYGYVPERTTLEILENGDIDFYSNNLYATVSVLQLPNSTTLSVIAL